MNNDDFEMPMTPEDAAASIPKLFEDKNYGAVHYILDEITESGGKQRAMELVEKKFRAEKKWELAAKCLPWLLEKLREDKEVGSGRPEDYFDVTSRK